MIVLSFLTSLMVAGGLFLPLPQKMDCHVHVGKAGHWTMTIKCDCRLLFGDGQGKGEAQLDEMVEKEREMYESLINGEIEFKARFTAERQIETVLTCKSDDVCDLVKLLRELFLNADHSTFSWDGRCLTLAGVAQKVEASASVPILNALLGPTSCRLVLTTDGKIIASEIPGELDEQAQRLLITEDDVPKSAAQQRTLKIEGLGVEPTGD